MSIDPKPVVRQLWRRYRCHHLIHGGISLVMFLRFVSNNFGFGGVPKPMPVILAVSTDLIDFDVIFTR